MSSLKKGARRQRWWGLRRGPQTAQEQAQEERPEGVGEALKRLCEAIDGKALPSGVIELVVQDGEPERHLLDVHDGQVAPVELGSAVPWASVRGTRAAWERALGSEGDVSQLRHTGEPHLAAGLLGELKRRRLRSAGEQPCGSVPDCS